MIHDGVCDKTRDRDDRNQNRNRYYALSVPPFSPDLLLYPRALRLCQLRIKEIGFLRNENMGEAMEPFKYHLALGL